MDIILTLSVSLAVALVLGYVTQRLGLSPIVGYLVAGILVSPNTPGLIANHEIASELADVGIVLLMFGVGLHFDLKELRALRRVALPGALLQCVAATAIGGAAALLLGGAPTLLGAVVYGLALSVASTVVMTRVLADHDDLHTPTGHLAVGWTIVEDLITVVILVLLPAIVPAGGPAAGEPAAIGLAAAAGGGWHLLLSLGIALLKIGLLLVVLFLVGTRVVPWLLRQVATTRSRELFTLTVLVMALGIAVGSAKLFGVSMALGAFLAGAVVGRSDFSLRAATEALPLRDAFAVLFFVSVGMLLDPRAILSAPWLTVATLAVVIIGKPVISFLLVRAFRQPTRTALTVGLALGQVGEFSFILAGMGNALGILPEGATSALIAAAIVSIALSPLARRLVDPMASLTGRRRKAPGRVGDAAGDAPAPGDAGARNRAVIVGYGPVGRTLTRLLTGNGVSCTIVEMNLETVHRLRSQGISAIYGDAAHEEVLRRAGVARAGSFILGASGLRAAGEMIRQARELNPEARILARVSYLRERPALEAAGADLVFAEEGEVALALNDAILREMGATSRSITRKRERLRADLFREG